MEILFTLFILFMIGLVLSKLVLAGKSGVSKNNSFNHTSTNNQFYGTESIDNGRHDRQHDHHHHHDHGGNCDYGGGSDFGGGGDSGGGGGCD